VACNPPTDDLITKTLAASAELANTDRNLYQTKGKSCWNTSTLGKLCLPESDSADFAQKAAIPCHG